MDKQTTQQLIVKPDYLLYQDPCGRYWKLVPIYNPQIMLPFLVKPLREEEWEQLKTSVSL